MAQTQVDGKYLLVACAVDSRIGGPSVRHLACLAYAAVRAAAWPGFALLGRVSLHLALGAGREARSTACDSAWPDQVGTCLANAQPER